MTPIATSVPQEHSIQRNALLGTPSQNFGLAVSKISRTEQALAGGKGVYMIGSRTREPGTKYWGSQYPARGTKYTVPQDSGNRPPGTWKQPPATPSNQQIKLQPIAQRFRVTFPESCEFTEDRAFCGRFLSPNQPFQHKNENKSPFLVSNWRFREPNGLYSCIFIEILRK